MTKHIQRVMAIAGRVKATAETHYHYSRESEGSSTESIDGTPAENACRPGQGRGSNHVCGGGQGTHVGK